MISDRQPFVFSCAGETLIGILHCSAPSASIGVLIVVGGPQYRVGSHRQFVLLADQLAAHGVPVMRFDCRGMGDSTGLAHDFEEHGPDLSAALDAFHARVPGLKQIVLWGLCDGASAALLYAPLDSRVSGVVLVNPWMRSAQGQARARLRHYYPRRLMDADTWRRLITGELRLGFAVRALAGSVTAALGSRSADLRGAMAGEDRDRRAVPLHERMADALERYTGRVLVVLAGQDLTAQEFMQIAGASRRWRRLLGARRITRRYLPEATHTFSSRQWRDQVAAWTTAWVTAA